jgi:hypothetical protein
MLDDFDFNVDDRDVILRAMIPYLVNYDRKTNTYKSGPMLQGKLWFDLFLNQFGLEFIEESNSRKKTIKKLSSAKCKILIGVNRLGIGKHAVVFQGAENSTYVFQNIKYKDSPEPDLIKISEDDLFKCLDETSSIGWIERMDKPMSIDFCKILQYSIETFDTYQTDIMNLVEKRLTVFELVDNREKIFTSLFLDFYSMMDIIGESDIREKLNEARKCYIGALKLEQDIVLKNYLNIPLLDNILVDIKSVVQQKISALSKTGGQQRVIGT